MLEKLKNLNIYSLSRASNIVIHFLYVLNYLKDLFGSCPQSSRV